MNLSSLSKAYNRHDVLRDLRTFLTPNFKMEEKVLPLPKTQKYDAINTVTYLGKSPLFQVFEINHNKFSDARVTLTKQAVSLMKDNTLPQALFFFVPEDKKTFRISLVTVDWANNKQASNPRRYSFLVGEEQKVHTAIKQLSSGVINEDDLLKRFSIEVVNDKFYDEISKHFEDLLQTINYPSVCQQEKQEEAKRNFAVRLIGRLIFCWFLKKKIRQDGSALIPEDLLSSKVVEKYENYYHEILEALFFETLNKQLQNRIPKCRTGLFAHIPFLNGGLFEAHDPEDGYKYDEGTDHYVIATSIGIQNNWFVKFFETLETYNFTIDENTSTDIDLAVDPEMLGRIFENLLASINPETKESVRKATGSYYTPREIVDYMVTQSLKQYLYTKTDIDHAIIDSLFEFDSQVDQSLSFTQKQKIYTALSEIKVLDPAVGSGAFPMGVLQKMMSIIHIIDPMGDVYKSLSTSNINISQNLTSKALDYANKLTLIQKCIYGVDIQPMAIEICRLRFFLTLIVEEESENPQPLPNLNFNFVCANSLIPLDVNNILELKQQIQEIDEKINEINRQNSIGGQETFGISKEKKQLLDVAAKEMAKLKKEKETIKKQLEKANVNSFLNGEDYIALLRSYRKEFFVSSGERKEVLKKKFIDTQRAMLDALKVNDWGNDKVSKLQAWRPFDNVSTGWFDPSWMFDVEDGFDIVIANPPYGADIDKITDLLSKLYPATSKAFRDIYKYFFDKSIRLIKSKGVLAFITPNTYLRQSRYADLRQLLLKYSISSLIDFGDNVFEGVVVPTAVICLNKYLPKDNFLSFCDLTQFKNPKSMLGKVNFVLLNQDDWNDKTTNYSFVKISNHTVDNVVSLDYVLDMKDAGINYQRVKVGLSSKGKTDLGKRLLYTGQQENIQDIEFWKGSDIDEYFIASQTNRYCRQNIKLNYNERVIINQQYFKKMPKLLWRQTAPYPISTIDLKGVWFGRSIQAGTIKVAYSKKVSYPFLCALLNSRYLRFKYNELVRETGKIFPQVKLEKLKPLPIVIANPKQQQEISNIVSKILSITQSDDYLSNSDKQSRVKAYQDEIDQMVYKLYGLTDEEIKIVEDSQPKKKS